MSYVVIYGYGTDPDRKVGDGIMLPQKCKTYDEAEETALWVIEHITTAEWVLVVPVSIDILDERTGQ